MKEIDGLLAKSEERILDIQFVKFAILVNSFNECTVLAYGE